MKRSNLLEKTELLYSCVKLLCDSILPDNNHRIESPKANLNSTKAYWRNVQNGHIWYFSQGTVRREVYIPVADVQNMIYDVYGITLNIEDLRNKYFDIAIDVCDQNPNMSPVKQITTTHERFAAYVTEITLQLLCKEAVENIIHEDPGKTLNRVRTENNILKDYINDDCLKYSEIYKHLTVTP